MKSMGDKPVEESNTTITERTMGIFREKCDKEKHVTSN
jgi:hypothetical protein